MAQTPGSEAPAFPTMTDRIRTLVKRISETRPVQSARRQTLLQELRELRADLDAHAVPNQARSLDAALLLMEFMSRSDDVATAETLQIVASLVSTIDESKLRPTQAPSHLRALPTPSRDVAEHHDLRMTQEFLLGSILLQAGVISADSLARALQLHSTSHLSLGQSLVQLGAASPEQIASAVAYQDRLREYERGTASQGHAHAQGQPQGQGQGQAHGQMHGQPQGLPHAQPYAQPQARPHGQAHAYAPVPGEMQLSDKQRGFVQSMHAQVLGEVLIRLGSITREQLEYALQVQRAASVHIGEALIETGAANWDQIRKALEVQKKLRRGVA